MRDRDGMDSNWIPPKASNEEIERALKQREDERRTDQRKQEQYSRGDYT